MRMWAVQHRQTMPTKHGEIPDQVPRDRPLRVLLVDDDRDDALLFAKALKGMTTLRSELTVVQTYAEGLKRAREGGFDVHFVDLRIGPESGLGLMAAVLEDSPRKPFVVITGTGDERMAADAIRKGAADYLPKASLSPNTVLECIFNCYSLRESSTIELQIEERPAFDKQTDVYSRDLFLSAARNRIAAGLAPGDHWCMLLIEIDGFSDIQDQTEAARVLRLVAQAIRVSLSDTEPVGRCDPYRFCLLISCSGIDEGMQLAEQIRLEVQRSTPATVSIGVAATLNAMTDLDTLLNKAATAAARAADNGRNCVHAL